MRVFCKHSCEYDLSRQYDKLILIGRDVAAQVLKFLEDHKIQSDALICVGGDATASNSGPFVSENNI